MELEPKEPPIVHAAFTDAEFEQLIENYQVLVWRYLRALGCDCPTADDLTQETFLAVYRHPFDRINAAATAGYLRRVAFHLALANRKKSNRFQLSHQFTNLEETWMRWAGFDSGDSMLELLQECFQRLTQRAQFALRMRFTESASRSSIAQSLGIGEHGAKNLLQRAKEQLRQCIESRL